MEEITDPEEFDSKILNSGQQTLVLFYASWCPFCMGFKPIFEASNPKNTKKAAVVIDEDENPLWDRFDIKLVPTIILFDKGKIKSRRDAKGNRGLAKLDMVSIMNELV